MSDRLRVAPRELRAVVDRLLAELERRHGKDIDLGADFYWNLDLSNSYDLTTVKREVDVGSLADDVESLKAAAELPEGDPIHLWHELEQLVGILRRVAYLDSKQVLALGPRQPYGSSMASTHGSPPACSPARPQPSSGSRNTT